MPGAGLVHFDDYRLDAPNAQLWRGEQVLKLSHKALSVLDYLVNRPATGPRMPQGRSSPPAASNPVSTPLE